jgi:plastocyanin
MRRLLLIGAAAIGLAISGLAVGATEHQVTLTATGIQPANTQVGWGDTIVFTNTDSAQHTLLIPRLELTKDIPAGGTYTHLFEVEAGSYQVRDRFGSKTNQGRVEVAVAAAGSLTLSSAATVVFGKPLAVKGISPYGASPVLVQTRPPGQGATWATLATLTPGIDGSFVGSIALQRGGRLQATAAGGQLRSAPVIVTVVPVLAVKFTPKRPAVGAFAKILATLQPAGAATTATLERYDTLRKRWVRVKTVPIRSTGVAAFAVRMTKVVTSYRVVIGRSSSQPGFATVTSKPFKITPK